MRYSDENQLGPFRALQDFKTKIYPGLLEGPCQSFPTNFPNLIFLKQNLRTFELSFTQAHQSNIAESTSETKLGPFGALQVFKSYVPQIGPWSCRLPHFWPIFWNKKWALSISSSQKLSYLHLVAGLRFHQTPFTIKLKHSIVWRKRLGPNALELSKLRNWLEF